MTHVCQKLAFGFAGFFRSFLLMDEPQFQLASLSHVYQKLSKKLQQTQLRIRFFADVLDVVQSHKAKAFAVFDEGSGDCAFDILWHEDLTDAIIDREMSDVGYDCWFSGSM